MTEVQEGIALLEAHAQRLGTISTRPSSQAHDAPARRALSSRGDRYTPRVTSSRVQTSEHDEAERARALAEAVFGDADALNAGGHPQETNSLQAHKPQRVDPPREINAPVRRNPEKVSGDVLKPQREGGVKNKLKDLEVRAAACRRAGRQKEEGEAYFCMGVLMDNSGQQRKSLQFYDKYLRVCRAIGDVRGQGLALNCIGINLYELGEIESSIQAHQQHLEIADVAGKFVAHSNMGICYGDLGDAAQADLNHRHALRYAIVLSSVQGEALACGNLGTMNLSQGDATTARACMERQLKLSSALHNAPAQAAALDGLGRLAQEEGDLSGARDCFEKARDIAKKGGAGDMAANAKVEVGMARGEEMFGSFVNQYAGVLMDGLDDEEEDDE